ncbi:MAG: zinc-binding dehydrogenase [Verrucomicrobia bacterium]|nr:zinc-binding dehydrogenase [Verrucomicrobiota bacterium]
MTQRKMKAIQIDTPAADIEKAIQSLKVVELPIPKPGPGEVLVKMGAATCNPSDLAYLLGVYGTKLVLPSVPGIEGMGTVVETGGGALGWWLKGKRVAVALRGRAGVWAEYFIAKQRECVILKESVSDEQGATLLVNGFSAVAMIEQAKKEGHKGIVLNAAASQLASKIRALAKMHHIPVVNIVRNQAQVEKLTNSGEKWTLNSQDEQYLQKLGEMTRSLDATIAFDAIAGEATGKMLNVMPEGSVMVVYGAMSREACKEISAKSLIFERKRVEGFWVSTWVNKSSLLHKMRSLNLIQELVKQGEFVTQVQGTSGFEGWKDLLLTYSHKLSEGKVILTPSSDSHAPKQ